MHALFSSHCVTNMLSCSESQHHHSLHLVLFHALNPNDVVPVEHKEIYEKDDRVLLSLYKMLQEV